LTNRIFFFSIFRVTTLGGDVKKVIVASMLLGLFFASFAQTNLIGRSRGEDQIIKRIEVKSFFKFNEVDKDIKWDSIFLKRMDTQVFATDGVFLFFLDSRNHRILKYDQKGNFIKQIGRIGQSDKALYWPGAIAIYNHRLYVVDQAGTKIKSFELDGDLINAFAIPNAWMTMGFAVNFDGQILVATIFPKIFPQKKLVSVFDSNGKRIGEFGEPNVAEEVRAFAILNQCQILACKEAYYIAFHAVPKIMIYSKTGEYQSTIDLTNKEVETIDSVDSMGKKAGLQNNVKIDAKGVHTEEYFNDLAVDEDGVLYYATTNKMILSINPNGKIESQIRLTKDGIDLAIWKLLIVGGERRVVVSASRKTGFFLVSF
jgi:sugar lactone lactonase YvrE